MRLAWALVPALLACASAPGPAPGKSQAWGYLRLVPREGVTPGGRGPASYGDRRLRDVEFVDYSRPGFAVVYVEAEQAPQGDLAIAIRSSRVMTQLEPAHAAVGAAGRILVANETRAEHVLSYPAAGVVRRIQPGERVELDVARAGEQGLFLLDVPDAASTLFAAPGPFAVVSDAGLFELRDLEPGARQLRAWHPRFPDAQQPVELAPDGRLRVDFELGVGREEPEEHSHAH
jgi:hypothetical protein